MLTTKLMHSRCTAAVKVVTQETFYAYGMPRVFYIDNGTPFCATNGVLTLTKLSTWWMSLSVFPGPYRPPDAGTEWVFGTSPCRHCREV